MTFNQFSKFGTPVQRNQIFNSNLKENFQSIKQFSKFGTPIHKNKNLNLKEGQLERRATYQVTSESTRRSSKGVGLGGAVKEP